MQALDSRIVRRGCMVDVNTPSDDLRLSVHDQMSMVLIRHGDRRLYRYLHGLICQVPAPQCSSCQFCSSDDTVQLVFFPLLL